MSALPVAATALPIGIAFGFLLERAGLGDPRVILGQLALRDFTVIRVMFGAIVTAMLLTMLGSAAGWIDLASIAIPPTDLGAQALGGVIFGGGFALAALCPGTACVAAASGRRDGIVAVGGIFLGTAVTPLLWPALGAAALKAPREGATIPGDTGWPIWTVVLAITLLGVAASMVARRVEQPSVRGWWRPRTTEFGALALAILFAIVSKPAITPLDAIDLATWIKDRRQGVTILDLREDLDTSTYMIPGATLVPLSDVTRVNTQPNETVVLYADAEAPATRASALLRAKGVKDVRVLTNGMTGWENEVLAPRPPEIATDSAQRRYERARALSLWFGGKPSVGRGAVKLPAAPTPAKRRRNTC